MMTGLPEDETTTLVTVVKFADREAHGKKENGRGPREVPGRYFRQYYRQRRLFPPHAAVFAGYERHSMAVWAPVPLFADFLSLAAQGGLLHFDAIVAERAGNPEHDTVAKAPQLHVSQGLRKLGSVSHVPEDVASSRAHQVPSSDLGWGRVAVVNVTTLETLGFVVVGDQRCLTAGTHGMSCLCAGIS